MTELVFQFSAQPEPFLIVPERWGGSQRALLGWGEDDSTGRAHGGPVADTKGKKGMQGKETVGVLPLRCGALYVNTSTQRPELRDREYNLSV